jgi:hypothetical protein
LTLVRKKRGSSLKEARYSELWTKHLSEQNLRGAEIS